MILYLHGFASGPGSTKGLALEKLFARQGVILHRADLTPGPVRDAFYRKVAGKSPSAVKSYWNQLIFSGREVPQVSKTTDDDVVAYVHANPGALAYVAADTDAKGVKTIELKD